MANYEEKYKSLKQRNAKIKQRALELETQVENIAEMEKIIYNYKEQIKQLSYEHERQIMYKDTEIDRLKISLEDYKERYKEIRDDNKELRRNNK
jgi:chromosome segregation ATPase|tara:strand:+ start:37 stop:318 length:282 start_codon:yes stop_codon:yes gene_type:complete